MEDKNNIDYTRIRKIDNSEGNDGNNKEVYEIIGKKGITYIDKKDESSILGVIKDTLKEAFKEGYEAQDILLFEGEKPEIRVKGRWQVLEECERWKIEHFNYFLFNMSMLKTKNRTGVYKIGKETIVKDYDRKLNKYVNKKDLDLKTTVDLRSKNTLEKYGNRFLDNVFFRNLMMEREGSYDYSISKGDSILRCHVYSIYGRGNNSEAAAISIRVIPKRIPKLHELNLPDKLGSIIKQESGLFLVSGRTGDGKSTTVASIINKYNLDYSLRRVITVIEDPIEFVHNSQNARIIQRMIGDNVPSYARATDDSLRESGDIVVLGELKNKEEITNALRLAEVGKLVIATIHANSVTHTVDRFVEELGGDNEKYRKRMMENLLGILHQNLVVYNGEQYPLSSMMLLENEETRKILREKDFERNIIKSYVEGEGEGNWAVGHQDWFSEKERKAYELKEKIDNQEIKEDDLKNHDRKLLELLNEDAREVIIGESSF